MSEILTESFCERCGTRYTFESARPKIRLKGVKVLSRGLKNFVLSDDTTMDEAMAAARSETDREVTAHQLDAFHRTFNFCMSCRQYTCPNCWNEVEARCQSCAPLPEPEIAPRELEPAALPGLVALTGATTLAEPVSNGANGHHHDETAADEATVPGELAATAAEGVAGVSEAIEADPEAMAAEPEAIAGESESVVERTAPDDIVAEPAAKAASQTAGLLHRFRPGQSLDDELAAFERERSSAATQAPASPAIETAPAPADSAAVAQAADEPIASVAEVPIGVETVIESLSEATADEPVSVTADVEAPTDLVAAELEPEPVDAAQLEPEPVDAAPLEPAPVEAALAAPPAADIVEQPAWSITAPDLEAPPVGLPQQRVATPPIPATGPSLPTAEPQWPAKPEWPAAQASVGLPFLGRPAQPKGGVESLWAASNRELVATPPAPGRSPGGIQPCVSCGLSLSANARFCRRCGTLQGG